MGSAPAIVMELIDGETLADRIRPVGPMHHVQDGRVVRDVSLRRPLETKQLSQGGGAFAHGSIHR